MCVSEPDMIVTSGASPTGWGYDPEGVQYGGHWSQLVPNMSTDI